MSSNQLLMRRGSILFQKPGLDFENLGAKFYNNLLERRKLQTSPYKLPDSGRARCLGRSHHTAALWPDKLQAFFYFYIFQNSFLQKYIFSFIIYRFIPLPPGRGAAGGLPPVCGAGSTLPPPYRAVGA